MSSPKIAVLIVNWRQPALTIDCVKSVLNNNYPNFKIFLINNGSNDNSEALFGKNFSNNHKVTVVQVGENLGYTGGNNLAANVASKEYSPEYLLILNNDTVAEKNFFTKLVAATEKYGKQNIYFPLIFSWKSKIIQSAGLRDYLPTLFQFKHKGRKDYQNIGFEEAKYLSGCCFLIKTNLFEKLKGFNEDYFMYSEDTDFGLRAQKIGIKFILVPQAEIWHKGVSGVSALSVYYSTRNCLFIIKKFKTNKFFEYLRAIYWLSALSSFHSLRSRRLKIFLAFIHGWISFLRKELGRNPKY